MKNKLITIIAAAVAIILLVCSFVLKFRRGVDVGWTDMISVELNEEFEASDVEAIMKEAGASDCIVLKQTNGETEDTIATIYYQTKNDTGEVFKKAEELLGNKYFLKYEGDYYTLTPTVDVDDIVKNWSAIIALALIVIATAIRFRLGAFTVLASFVEGVGATAGIISLTGIPFTNFTLGTIIASGAIATVFALALLLAKKSNAQKLTENIEAVSVKQVLPVSVLVCCAAAIALVLLLIFGGTVLKSFALTALIGIVVDAVIAVFVLPANIRTW